MCARLYAGVCAYTYICMGVHRSALECMGVCAGVRWFVQEYAGVYRSAREFTGVREFSEFLPENRVLTSADFNMYPIRIFFSLLILYRSMYLSTLEIYLKSMKKLNT